MKASFQRADLFVFTDFVGDLFPLFPDAKSANRQIVNGLQSGFQQNQLKVDTNIVLYQNLVGDTIIQI